MASWQAAWFFMPKLRSVQWTAPTSAFPHQSESASDCGGVPPQIVTIALGLVWRASCEYEKQHGNYFNITRLATSGMQQRITSFTCLCSDEDDPDTRLSCTNSLPRCHSITLRAGIVEVAPTSRALQHLEVIGIRRVTFYNARIRIPSSLPLAVLTLASHGIMELQLDEKLVVDPCKVSLAAQSLHAPRFPLLVSGALRELLLCIKDPSHSCIDLTTLPQGARASSRIDKGGYRFDWAL